MIGINDRWNNGRSEGWRKRHVGVVATFCLVLLVLVDGFSPITPSINRVTP